MVQIGHLSVNFHNCLIHTLLLLSPCCCLFVCLVFIVIHSFIFTFLNIKDIICIFEARGPLVFQAGYHPRKRTFKTQRP